MKAENVKTLIILTPGFPTDESDSTCLPAQQTFLLALNRNYPSIDIKVISFHYPYRSDKYLWNGIQVISLNGRNKRGFARLMIWMRAWRAILGFKKNAQIIGILSFWCTECGLVGKWFASYHKLKHQCWIMGQDAKKENGFIRLIRPNANELISLSDFLQNEFERNHHIKPAHVIPMGIDPQSFLPPEGARSIDMIGVGSLIPLKQYDVFIAIVKKIAERNPSTTAVICGQGSERNALQQLIDESGLNRNVLLLGERPHQEVLKLLQQSKILLHPARYEGLGMVCVEALYAGAHIISFVQPLFKEILHWNIVKTEEEMKEKVIQLLSNPGLDHTQVLLNTSEESAKAVVDLFCEKQNTKPQ